MRQIFRLILLITAVLLVERPVVQSAPIDSPIDPQLAIDADGLTLRWTVPPVQQQLDETNAVHFEIDGYQQTEQPGDYLLPVQATLIAVPADAQPTLEISAVQQATHALVQPVAIAPQPSGVLTDAQGDVIGGDYRPVADPNPQTPPLVQLAEAGTVRGVRLMRLTLLPVRPISEAAYVAADEVTVRVRFNTRVTTDSPMLQAAASDKLLQTVQTLVANPGQVAGYQSLPQRTQQALVAAAATPKMAIEVSQTGITAVTYADLIAADFPVASVNPNNLHLERAGVEIPFEWDGDGDTAFESNERILFFASPRPSRWFNGDVYLLYGDNNAGLWVGETAVLSTGAAAGKVWLDTTIEENKLYTPDCLCGNLPFGRDGDRWVWDFMIPDPQFQERTYNVSLPTANTSVDAEVTLWFIGYTSVAQNPDHQVDVSWNGASIGSVTWDGKTAVTTTLTIPSANLQATNEMTLSLVNPAGVTVNGIWFDAAQVRYARSGAQTGNALTFTGESGTHKYTIGLANATGLRIYDITDPDVPEKLTGPAPVGKTIAFEDPAAGPRRYAVSNSAGIATPDHVRQLKLLQNANGADYILIAPEAFMPATNGLVALRQSQGLQVVVEDVQAIYDNYGDGLPVPEAIHNYLADAYASWSPVPQYVLLVGDGSFDPKQYRDASTPTWIAPFFMEADPWLGEVPVDNRFVTFDGGNEDFLPDMLIGRLPVNSLSEAQIVVDKIVAYETAPEFGPWAGQVTFVADNTDNAGDFSYYSSSLIGEFIDPPWVPRTIFLQDNPLDKTVAAVQSQWADGSGILFYNGHSSRHQWAAERLFHTDDVANLQNGARLPVVLQMTCLTGSFHVPDLPTLDEELITQENGGAVAVWGATGLGVATGHHELSSGFLQTVIVDANPIMGQATLAGKLNLKNFHRDLIDTFTLLGDPAMRVTLDIPDAFVYLPLVLK